MKSHTVTLYTESIAEQCQQLFGSREFLAACVAIIFAHELGHAEDTELQDLSDRMDVCSGRERSLIALRIEENAWTYAERLLPDIDRERFSLIVERSLHPYRLNASSSEIAS